MPRWLMKFEIEAQLGIAPNLPFLLIKHPKSLWEAHLENFHMEPGCEIPLLIAYILFETDTIDAAEIIGKKYCAQLIDYLTFTTGTQFRIKKQLCLFDWTPKITERTGYFYKIFSDPNFPQLVLNKELGETVEVLLKADSNPSLIWALHRFAEAVNANGLEAQFELFWFTIETLASRSGSHGKVPDKCPICREPLYCLKCKIVAEHRPYQGQLIEQLFVKHISSNHDLAYKVSLKMRNTMLHGGDIIEVEKEYGVSLSKLVDIVGKVAWAGLLTAFKEMNFKGKTPRLALLEVNTFLNFEEFTKTEITFSSPTTREPKFTDIPDPKIDRIRNNELNGTEADSTKLVDDERK